MIKIASTVIPSSSRDDKAPMTSMKKGRGGFAFMARSVYVLKLHVNMGFELGLASPPLGFKGGVQFGREVSNNLRKILNGIVAGLSMQWAAKFIVSIGIQDLFMFLFSVVMKMLTPLLTRAFSEQQPTDIKICRVFKHDNIHM
ncbi:MAG: hypothetical protein MI924_31175 [Chloroflexales bacterium]|nr:hypothetical protein [Chloroflexales bacterium]